MPIWISPKRRAYSDQNILLIDAPGPAPCGPRPRTACAAGEAHDLALRVGPRQVLADDGIGLLALLPGELDGAPEVPGVGDVLGGGVAPRSLPRVVIVTRHPLLRPPITFATGARASVMNVSVKWLAPVICLIGRSSMPFGSPSSRRIGRRT
jgi:hypothetical protein